jgi:hypothetical protein
MKARPYGKTIVMNRVVAALFSVTGAGVLFLSRNDSEFTLRAIFFLWMMFLVIPIVCFATAIALAETVPIWKSTVSLALNAVVAVFSVPLLLLLYLSNRLNTGTIVVFVPFIINIVSLTAYRTDPTGNAI